MNKHSQARLWPSELITIGLLFVLKGGHFGAFYRWLKRDYAHLFRGSAHHIRLQQALKTHRNWCDLFLADPASFTVIDTYGIELIHPIRAGRSQRQIGNKGKSIWPEIVGVNLCWLGNGRGEVVACDWNTANVRHQVFLPVVERVKDRSIVLADLGFSDASGIPANLKLCPRATRNECMLVETMLSMMTMVCHVNKMSHRVRDCVEMHFAYLQSPFNTLLGMNRLVHPQLKASNDLLHIAQYGL